MNQEPTTNDQTPENLLNADIPDKFIDKDTGQVRMEDFVKSYKALEQEFSKRPSAPKTPDEYCIDCTHGLFETDPEVNKRLHAKGFTQEQAQEVYALAAERMIPIIAQIQRDAEADRAVEKLINHFGGVDAWKSISGQLLAFGQKALPADVLANMSSSYEGVLALHRLMQSEEPGLNSEGTSTVAVGAKDEDALKAMMRDPRYWKDRDPEFIKQVTEGFESVYS